MATKHAKPGEVVDLASWAGDLSEDKSKAITKSSKLELARLVIPADKHMHRTKYCHVSGPIVVHCLEGEIEFRTPEKKVILMAGQLVYLTAETDHAISGIQDSVVLLTIVLTN